jgi:hypothetical protein
MSMWQSQSKSKNSCYWVINLNETKRNEMKNEYVNVNVNVNVIVIVIVIVIGTES